MDKDSTINAYAAVAGSAALQNTSSCISTGYPSNTTGYVYTCPYISYPSTVFSDRYEKAVKVAKMLMEKKLQWAPDAEAVVELIEEIAKLL